MEPLRLLRAILPDVLIDNFDVVNFEKNASRFDIWLDEKKVGQRIFPQLTTEFHKNYLHNERTFFLIF